MGTIHKSLVRDGQHAGGSYRGKERRKSAGVILDLSEKPKRE